MIVFTKPTCYNRPLGVPMSTSLAIKGIGDRLVISMPQGEWTTILPELMHAIDERGDFFKGAKVVLQVEDRELGPAQLVALRQALAQREITLWALMATNEGTCAAAAKLGIDIDVETTPHQEQVEEDDFVFDSDLPGDEAILVERTLRSGQRLRHAGHVIVIGDVNPGSEIVAGGHILVWGRLRGTVHAGAAGDESATVCALDMMPTQLRIAGHIAVSPKRRGRARPEVAFVRDGQLVAETWENSDRS
jgi:septum site-determining protein MinC